LIHFLPDGIPESFTNAANPGTFVIIEGAEEDTSMTACKYWPLSLLLILLTACTQKPQNSEDLREKTAETTAAVKRDAKAVASGIREGWSRDKPLDLNSATRDQLMSLPGVDDAAADRIVAGRPYSESDELVRRRIVSRGEFDKIADRVSVKR
jgi:competence protein ComEA